jgi:hypothetical protein
VDAAALPGELDELLDGWELLCAHAVSFTHPCFDPQSSGNESAS